MSSYNNIIHRIKEYIPNENIKLSRNKKSYQLQIIFVNKKSILEISAEDTWDKIKRRIDQITIHKDNCPICDSSPASISCNKCYGSYCLGCYINIFKTNKGIIICPYCRDKIGWEMPENIIDFKVQEILQYVKK